MLAPSVFIQLGIILLCGFAWGWQAALLAFLACEYITFELHRIAGGSEKKP